MALLQFAVRYFTSSLTEIGQVHDERKAHGKEIV